MCKWKHYGVLAGLLAPLIIFQAPAWTYWLVALGYCLFVVVSCAPELVRFFVRIAKDEWGRN
jgi:hypothetical protein